MAAVIDRRQIIFYPHHALVHAQRAAMLGSLSFHLSKSFDRGGKNIPDNGPAAPVRAPHRTPPGAHSGQGGHDDPSKC